MIIIAKILKADKTCNIKHTQKLINCDAFGAAPGAALYDRAVDRKQENVCISIALTQLKRENGFLKEFFFILGELNVCRANHLLYFLISKHVFAS